MKPIMVLPFVLMFLVSGMLLIAFYNSLKFAENDLGSEGFEWVRPLTASTYYEKDGTYRVELKNVRKQPITIEDLRISDRINDHRCTLEESFGGRRITERTTFNVTAQCLRQNEGDMYSLKIRIRYRVNESTELVQEDGSVMGYVGNRTPIAGSGSGTGIPFL